MIALLLFAVLLLAYYPALHGTPIWDDDAHLTKPQLRSWAGLGRIWYDLRATQQYYPVTHSVFWVEHRIWDDWFTGYHLVNICLHTISALMLARILRRFGIRGAWFAAALWALHPVQVESVAWMSELKNTLSAVCYFGSALLYLRFRGAGSRRAYFAALGVFAIGLLTKSVIDTLPAALLLLFYWKQGKLLWRKDVRPLIPFFATGIVSGLFTAWVEHTFVGASANGYQYSLIGRCLIAGRAFWFYLGKLLWPAELIFSYPRWQVSTSVWWQFLFPALALGLVALLVWMRRRWGRGPLVAVLYFAGTLFPALGFVNVYPFRFSFVADHFQYLACIGPIVLVAAGVERLQRRFLKGDPLLAAGLCAILLAILAVLTWRQSGIYRDMETLWRATIARNPESWMARNNLGIVLARQGQADEALAEYREALRINPAYADAHNDLGLLLAQYGHADEAIAEFSEALRINPAFPEAHNNAGLALSRQGHADQAIAEYREALRINPAYAEARSNLGAMLFSQKGHEEEAIAEVETAFEIDPSNAAIENNLAWLLAAAPQLSLRNGPRAVELAAHSNLATGGNNPVILRTLAAAYAAAGDFSDAVQTARKALQLDEGRSDTAGAEELRREIALYEAGHGFEDPR